MKKIISFVICAVMLLSTISVMASAADTDMMFSMKGAAGKPGDEVNVEVYVDKNVGTWAAYFHVKFDSRALKLVDVKNGKVFKDKEFTKSLLTNDGYYIYYAQMDNPTENNTNTGLILTVTFQITEKATNGDHDVWLSFPDNGVGWFFDAKNLDNDRSVPKDGEVKAAVTVSGSDAEPEPETDTKGVVADDEPEESAVVIVTDNSGEVVTDDKGEAETTVVKGVKQKNVPMPETDAAGKTVRDSDGKVETYFVNDEGERIERTNVETDERGFVVDPETAGNNEEIKDSTAKGETDKQTAKDGSEVTETDTNGQVINNGKKNGEKDSSDVNNDSSKKIILIAAVAAIVVAAVIIIAVVSGSRKKDKADENNNI